MAETAAGSSIDAPVVDHRDPQDGTVSLLDELLLPMRWGAGSCPARWFRPGEAWACTRPAGHVGGHRLRRTLA